MDSNYNKLSTGAWQEMNISELGTKEDMIDGITEGILILEGGYDRWDHGRNIDP